MVKDKIQLSPGLDLNQILKGMEESFKDYECNTIDGLKVNFEDSWVHMRRSNTEPIVRIYSEAPSIEKAEALVAKVKAEIEGLLV
jgi:phosphomannomutase